MVALFVVLTIVAFLLVDAIVLWARRRAAPADAAAPVHLLAELLPQPELPGGVFLSPNHLWAALMPSGQVRIGLDPLILSVLGTPDRVDAPQPGVRIRKGDTLFAARWGGRSIAFQSPVDGNVEAGATAGEGDLEGWVLTMQPSHARNDLGVLPLAEEARQWFAQEWSRLREFAGALGGQTASPALALADGGRPMAGWLNLEPDSTWDRFVEGFLRGEGAEE